MGQKNNNQRIIGCLNIENNGENKNVLVKMLQKINKLRNEGTPNQLNPDNNFSVKLNQFMLYFYL